MSMLRTGVGRRGGGGGTVPYSEESPTGSAGVSGGGGFTMADREWAIDNGATITHIGLSATDASTGSGKVKIVKRNSEGNYDVVVSESFDHPGGGWADKELSTPYEVPATGDYHAAVWWGNDITYDRRSVSRAWFSGDATGTGVTFNEDTAACPITRVSGTKPA